jgi:hypothetical protein
MIKAYHYTNSALTVFTSAFQCSTPALVPQEKWIPITSPSFIIQVYSYDDLVLPFKVFLF